MKTLHVSTGQVCGFDFHAEPKMLQIIRPSGNCLQSKILFLENVWTFLLYKKERPSISFLLNALKSHTKEILKKIKMKTIIFCDRSIYMAAFPPMSPSGVQHLPPCQFINQKMLLPTGHKRKTHHQCRGLISEATTPFPGQKWAQKIFLADQREEKCLFLDNQSFFLLHPFSFMKYIESGATSQPL